MSELPSGWSSTTIGEIADTIRGVTYKKAEAAPAPGDGRVPLLRATNIVDGGLKLDRQLVYVPSTRVSDAQRVVVGDIVIAASSGSRAVVGKSASLKHDWLGTFGAFCSVVRPTSAVDAPYLAYYVGSEAVRRRWSDLATGTNINNLKREHFTETPVLLPPLNEQRRIVAAIEEHLSRLDAADASLAAAAKRLDPLRERVFEASQNGSPTKPLGELLREALRNGHSAKANREGTIRTITLTAVTRGEFTDEHTKLTSADPAKARALWLEPSDIFIERSNTPELVGTAALYNGPRDWAIFPDLLIRVRVGDAVLPEFLEIVLKSRPARTHFRRAAQGIAGSMPKIDQGAVERLEVPVPPLEEQRRIVAEVEARLSALDSLRASIANAQRRSAALRTAVLAQAFRGELVPQDPCDEPADQLLARIRAERDAATSFRKPRRRGPS